MKIIHLPHPHWPRPTSNWTRPLRISVLDSSFNPPTIAHLALARHGSYDARLLLLSVRNVDKQLKSGDASHEQRVELMKELAKDVDNTAIAVIDEPTFVGKSSLLHGFFKSSGASHQFTFLLGLDTLERLFSPRYYVKTDSIDPVTQMQDALHSFFVDEGSRIVCARRAPSSYPAGSISESELVKQIHEFMASKSLESDKYVTLLDIGDDVAAISSSAVRANIAQSNDDWKTKVTPNVALYITKNGLYHTQ